MFEAGKLQELIQTGYLVCQKHPEQALYIYNYTALTQYEQVWNEITLQCRGLILNERQELVARPFPKFFNLGEQDNQLIPEEPFEVFEKMDGSLGIMYWIGDRPYIASRGSFRSEQAEKANRILYDKYPSLFDRLDKSKTYLFEIIYPENRIVVDYGGLEDLILLAVIDTQSGIESATDDWGFPTARCYNGIAALDDLRKREEENKEGFVIRFQSGLRYKVKFSEYIRIHRIVTQISNLDIWEHLRQGLPLEEILDRVPDEFYQWVKKTEHSLRQQYQQIEMKALSDFKDLGDRKATAAYFQSCSYPSILFKMLDGKDYAALIWRLIKPAYEKPFSKIAE
ncbi:MAG TPA: RNA ligase [Saprospiraceae bacterium]|nr:RNA ligase [Saprospiraceae bacterium]HMQ83824.1 RNA ligase [Saprospiraceae bacterium]